MYINTQQQLIAIDTEYHTDAHGCIDKVFCLCGTSNHGDSFKLWLDGTPSTPAMIMRRIKDATGYTDPVFVCHAFDKAERRALKFMGFDVLQMQFIDTYHLARMLTYSFDKKAAGDVEEWATDQEAVDAYNARKDAKEAGLSYAGLCHRYCLGMVDTAHKAFMRGLCITDNATGVEADIMDYCLNDTAYLLPLLNNLLHEEPGGYIYNLKRAFCPLEPGAFRRPPDAGGVDTDVALEKCIEQCAHIARFGDIADKGLPLSPVRVAAVQRNAIAYREQLKADFNRKYGNFKQDKHGVWHEDTTKTQEHMAALIAAHGLKEYPKTKRGYSVASNVLKDYFKGCDCFGEDYRQLNKLLKQLGSVAKAKDNPFDDYYDGCLHYDSLNPYGTITSRCAPSTKRFLFGWHKSLYGLLEPPPGKWLVELDFGSEETFCQCAICHDAVYNKIYNSKDIYLAFARQMGLIPSADWDSMSKAQLKEKYAGVRKIVKPMVLGLSYGMGVIKLAGRCGLSLDDAKKYHDQIVNGVLGVSTTWKKDNLRPDEKTCHGFALPDGFVCAYSSSNCNRTSVGNWSFQSAGGAILRNVVKALYGKHIDIRATIHDAVFFMVEAGDTATIDDVKETMRTVANSTLHASRTWSVKVGDPDIIKPGDVWTPEHEYDDAFYKLLNFDKGE